MTAYILRRLLLMIPTLLAIMVINFVVIHVAPGGPVEQIIAQLTGQGADITERVTRAGTGESTMQVDQAATSPSKYRGAQGLDPEFIAELERRFGFDKPLHARLLIMLRNYFTFNFGESFFRDRTVIELIIEKMPVSISLGVWTTLIIYLISIPLGIRKAVKVDTPFDMAVSGTTAAKGEEEAADYVADYASAGATWWIEEVAPIHFGFEPGPGPWPMEKMRDHIAAGPPRC